MKENKRNQSTQSPIVTIIGISLIIVGTILMLGKILQVDIDVLPLVFNLWPLIFVGIGINFFIKKNSKLGWLFSVIGIFLILNNYFTFNIWARFWPLFLIGIGIYMLIKKDGEINMHNSDKSDEEMIDDIVAFSGLEKKITAKNFKGGRNVTVFGGTDLDLRDIKIAKSGAVLELNAIFGGIDVSAPEGYKVKVESTEVLGGVENNIKEQGRKEPVLTLKCTAVFGGIDIK